MDAEELGIEIMSGGDGAEVDYRARWHYAVMLDSGDGEPARRIVRMVWDDEHKAVLLCLE